MTAGCLLGALALLGLSIRGNYTASTWTPHVLAHANSQLYGWVGFFIMGFSLQHHAPTVARQRLFHRLAWATLGLMSIGILLRFLAEPLAQNGSSLWVNVGVLSAIFQAVAVILFVANTALTRYRPTVTDGSNLVVLRTSGGDTILPQFADDRAWCLGRAPFTEAPKAESVSQVNREGASQEHTTPSVSRHNPAPFEGAFIHPKNKPLTWQTSFVFLSLVCFLTVALAEPFVFAGSHQADKSSSIMFVAEWFAPLRELQFLGFVSSMIFGVGLAKFHECLGAGRALPAFGLAGFVCWTIGLLCKTLGWLLYFRGGMQSGTGAMYFLGGSLLCLGAVFVVASSGVFGKLSGRMRSHKFIRASFVWLVVAGLMMVLEPRVLQALGLPFSHAYTGAVRHAVTVGFVSQMIIGFSSRIVPNIMGMEESLLPRLWPTFWLLNIGNAARVSLEVATDFTPLAFKPMGFTGFIELVGLALWATHILKLLLAKKQMAVTYGTR